MCNKPAVLIIIFAGFFAKYNAIGEGDIPYLLCSLPVMAATDIVFRAVTFHRRQWLGEEEVGIAHWFEFRGWCGGSICFCASLAGWNSVFCDRRVRCCERDSSSTARQVWPVTISCTVCPSIQDALH